MAYLLGCISAHTDYGRSKGKSQGRAWHACLSVSVSRLLMADQNKIAASGMADPEAYQSPQPRTTAGQAKDVLAGVYQSPD